MKSPMAYNMNTRERWAAVSRLPELADLNGKTVLDVGSGLGFFSMQFKDRGATVEGIDIDAGAVDFVRKLGFDARVLDITTGTLPAERYDLIFVGEVLEHLKEPGEFYRKMYAALRPGGYLVITTPALEGWLTLSRGKQLAHDHGGQKHEREGFWQTELETLARSAGMVPVRHEFCVHTIAELFMQLTKLGYLLSRKDYEGQSDVLALINKPSFRLLRGVFPIVWPFVEAEDWVARRLRTRGHCHVQVTQRPVNTAL
jgi:SAM-dependent methyltransferase